MKVLSRLKKSCEDYIYKACACARRHAQRCEIAAPLSSERCACATAGLLAARARRRRLLAALRLRHRVARASFGAGSAFRPMKPAACRSGTAPRASRKAAAPYGATAAPATRALVSTLSRSPAPTHSHASRRPVSPPAHAVQRRPFPGRRPPVLPPLPILGWQPRFTLGGGAYTACLAVLAGCAMRAAFWRVVERAETARHRRRPHWRVAGRERIRLIMRTRPRHASRCSN